MGGKVHNQNFDSWIQDRPAFHNPKDMFGDNFPALVGEEGSIFPVPKDDLIRVEDLYKCSDLNDDVLGLNASNQRMHYNFGEFLTLEYHPTKPDHDIPDSDYNLSDDVEIFCNGILGTVDAIFPQDKNILSDSYESYVLDNKSVNEATVAASSPVFDNMTVDQLNEAFRNIFGRETAVTDKQWLTNRLSFGSQNLIPSNNNKKTDIVTPTSNQGSNVKRGLSSDVFNFKKKPRIQRVKRKWPANRAFFKELSSEGDENPKPECSETKEDDRLVVIKRLRKPTLSYAEEFIGQDLKHQKKKRGDSTTRRPKKRFEAKRFICLKETFNGESIQVPFGEPQINEPMKKKVHQPKDLKKGNRLVTSSVDTELEAVSVESQELISEDDCNNKKMKNARRKHHVFWSVSEVINLIEGVSLYGVGRWTEIKKLMFNSSPNRTSVDLKDKWRNLLRASCSKSKKNSEVEPRKKHLPQQMPPLILHRVKELAAINPYPRPHLPIHNSKTSCVTSPVPNSAHKICLPMSTAVRV